MKNIFLFIVYFIWAIPSFSIEVGGHITEDTIWSPENNPYIVTQNLYVDEGVTLTIQPGTIIKLIAAEFTMYNYNHTNLFTIQDGESVAKMFWVDGRIVAEGTEEDIIVFTRLQDSLYYHWGTIYLSPLAELSRFKHCRFEYSAIICINLGLQPQGAIALYNGQTTIESCHFIDNYTGVSSRNPGQNILVKNNFFNYQDYLHSSFNNSRLHLYFVNYLGNSEKTLIAGNQFIGAKTLLSSGNPIQFVNNTVNNCITAISCHNFDTPSYFYKNKFINNSSNSIFSLGESTDTLYIKKNIFTMENGTSNGVDLSHVYAVISDNYFENCALYTGPNCSGKTYNNFANGGMIRTPGYLEVFNNIATNSGGTGLIVSSMGSYINNNSSINNIYAIGSSGIIHYNNCIIIGNNELTEHSIYGTFYFRNCLLDFELPPECIDAGGNIWVDSLSFDSIFVDWQNGDFHLLPESPAIDTGYDTTNYYSPFDLDYNQRVWDGDEDGNAIIDIGPYEFHSPYIGGIAGKVFQSENGEALDYVLLIINNQNREFEFSDSTGCFEFNLPGGVYSLYASRVFYDDVVIEGIEVFQGEITPLDFAMGTTVGLDDISPLPLSTVFMYNYPNPFNPVTTIRFSLQLSCKVKLSIYNIKGQKIKTLKNEALDKGIYSVIWDGTDRNGKKVASGLYLYKLSAGNETVVKKMLLIR
ncbi:MAG: T9SS type A sorting domain-containing protein [Candidatus Marinimicrobia bacterium]|nr:T9SS type A sorting domain-containing protein [Candidatus Neomarinimicrobiota bacterium]